MRLRRSLISAFQKLLLQIDGNRNRTPQSVSSCLTSLRFPALTNPAVSLNPAAFHVSLVLDSEDSRASKFGQDSSNNQRLLSEQSPAVGQGALSCLARPTTLLPTLRLSESCTWQPWNAGCRNYGTKAKKGKKKQKGQPVEDEDNADEDGQLADQEAVEDVPKGKKGGKGGKAKGANPADPGVATGDVLAVTRGQMDAATEALMRELSKLRTGRASPGMLDHVTVDAYGTPTPLNRVATVTVRDSQLLGVTLHDPNLLGAVEKGIGLSPMGLNPVREGSSLSVPVPRLTQEVRQAMTKLVVKAGEAAKVSLRRARKEGLDAVKSMADGMSEDVAKKQEKEIQELINKFTKEVDEILKNKEKEISIG